MKKSIKILTISFLAIVFILSSMLLTFAAEINSNPVNVGDTVTYELRVNPCPNKIQALDVVIYYDSNSLEYVPYSLELSNISGFMTNVNIIGEIRFNAMDFEGFDFTEDKVLSTVQFTVKDTAAQNLNLNYEIKTFIDSTTTDLRDMYVYDVTSVNGGVDRTPQHNESSVSSIDSNIFNSTVSTQSELNDNTDTDTHTDAVSSTASEEYTNTDTAESTDTDTNTDTEIETDTNTNLDNNSVAIDMFDEFLTEIVSEVSLQEETPTVPELDEKNNSNNTKLYIMAAAVAVVVVLIIGIIFSIIAKRSNKGSHFS